MKLRNWPPFKAKLEEEENELLPDANSKPILDERIQDKPKDLDTTIDDTSHEKNIQNTKSLLDDFEKSSKARAESIAKRKDLLQYQDEWSSKALDAGISISTTALLEFNQSRGRAMNLAEQYGQAENEQERNRILIDLENETAALKGFRSINLENAIEDHLNKKEQTAKEKKENYVATVEKFKSFATNPPREKIENVERSVLSEKEAMSRAENAYLEEYKKFYAQKGAKEKNEPEELKQLKKVYDESRISYGNTLSEKAQERLDSRNLKPGFEENKKMSKEAVLERYNRLVRYNEIIKPAAEKRYNARIEALGEREKGIFSKGLVWVGIKNKKLEEKFGKNGARFVRAAATTIVVGGGAAAAGAFGTAGLLGALGWGTIKFSRSIASSFAGAGAGELAAQAYGKFIGEGKQNEAIADLGYIGRTGNTLTIEELEAYDTSRLSLQKLADERTLEKEKMIARALVALTVGAGTSTFLSHLPSAGGAVNELTNGKVPIAESTPTGKAPEHLSGTHPQTTNPIEDHSKTPVPSTSPIEPVKTESLSIGGSVNNADRLLGHFRDQLHEQYPDPSKAPASVQTFFKAGASQDDLSKALGFQNVQSMSARMHAGDTIKLENNALVFHTVGDTGAGHTLIDAQGKISPIEAKFEHAPIVPLVQEVERATTAQVSEPAVVQEVERINTATTPPPAITLNDSPLHSNIAPHVEFTPRSTHIDAITTQQPTITLHDKVETNESPASIITNGPHEGIIQNKFGVLIDPTSPHVYQVKGVDKDFILMGGTHDDRLSAIKKFFSNTDNHDKKLLSQDGAIDPKTGRQLVTAYVANPGEGFMYEPNLRKKYGGIFGLFAVERPYTLPNTDTFTKIIQ